jgi:hypothetical protein
MLNYWFVKIPIGTEYWRLAMTQAIAAAATCVLLFAIAKRYSSQKKALIAPLVFCAAGVVVTQATIIETFCSITFIWVLAYYLHITGKIKSKYAVLAIGIGIHHLVLFPLGYIFIVDMVRRIKDKERPVRPAMFIPFLGLFFYLWIPYANTEPYHWILGNDFHAYMTYFFGQGGLIGGLGLSNGYEVLRRVQDFILMVGFSFGISTLLILPISWKILKSKGSEYIDDKLIVFLCFTPLIYYFTDKDPVTWHYMVPAFAFGGLLVVKAAEWVSVKWETKILTYGIPSVMAISCIAFMVFNTQVYDIGNNLDKDLQAVRYYESLDDIPYGAFIWNQAGSVAVLDTWLYDGTTGADITAFPTQFRSLDKNASKIEGANYVQMAREAYNNSNLWIVDLSFDDTTMICTNRKVTPETHDADFERIVATSDLYGDGFNKKTHVTTGWVSPVELMSGELLYTRWDMIATSNFTVGFLLMWFLPGWFCQDITNLVFGRKIKDKKKLGKLKWVTFIVVGLLLMLVCWGSGMKMIWM